MIFWIKKLFRRTWSKWIPLRNYRFTTNDCITFGSKNLKTGMLRFKTKKVNGHFGSGGCIEIFVPHNLIDTNIAWKELTKFEEVYND